VQLFLNAADHDLMRIAFLEAIKVIGADYTTVESMEGERRGWVRREGREIFISSEGVLGPGGTSLKCRLA
jgi:hypothetical protein